MKNYLAWKVEDQSELLRVGHFVDQIPLFKINVICKLTPQVLSTQFSFLIFHSPYICESLVQSKKSQSLTLLQVFLAKVKLNEIMGSLIHVNSLIFYLFWFRSNIQENVDLIKLQRDMKEKATKFEALQSKYLNLEEVATHPRCNLFHFGVVFMSVGMGRGWRGYMYL